LPVGIELQHITELTLIATTASVILSALEVAKDQRKRFDRKVTMFQKIREWLALKNYQYEVTTGAYVLQPWEKTIFSILLGKSFFIIDRYPGHCWMLFGS